MKYKVSIIMDVSCNDINEIKRQTIKRIDRMLDDASFISGKDELLVSVEIEEVSMPISSQAIGTPVEGSETT